MKPSYVFYLLLLFSSILQAEEAKGFIADGAKLLYEPPPSSTWRGDRALHGIVVDPQMRFVAAFGDSNFLPEFFALQPEKGSLLTPQPMPSPLPKNRKGRDALNGVFAPDGQHLYLTGGRGLEVLAVSDEAEWKAAQLTGDSFDPKNPPQRFDKIRFTPDSRLAIALRWEKSTYFVEVYERDPNSGVLTVRQAFQPDAKGREFLQGGAPPGAVVQIPGAISLAHFIRPTDLIVSPHGNYVFVLDGLASIFIFRVESKQKTLRFVRRLHEPEPGFQTTGLNSPLCVVFRHDARPQANDLFVGGIHRLAWFNWDSPQEELTPHRWWLDQAERERLKWESKKEAFPFKLSCTALAVSKNGRYLFLTTGGEPAPVVLELDGGDLKYVGMTDPGPQPADGSQVRNLNLALSPDGKYLFSQYSHCRLKVHALNERYWK